VRRSSFITGSQVRSDRVKDRLPYIALLAAAFLAWWISDHVIVPWIRHVTAYDRIPNRDLVVILAHWIFDQLPRVLVCVAVWLTGTRLGMMPSLRRSLESGGSWLRVVTTGLVATAVLLVLTVGIGAAAGGTFGFHPYFPKMVGDLVSNMYEEIVYRGLFFCAFYGLAAGASFPLSGEANRAGLIVGTMGSCLVFGVSHEQFPSPCVSSSAWSRRYSPIPGSGRVPCGPRGSRIRW
jgi:hypothetical protein